jgi:rSAM/selenodomain-associated transferase 2
MVTPAPLVSVVIPVLNDTAALGSLLPLFPPDPDAELLVVDAGDVHDPTMRALQSRYPHVAWIRAAAGRGGQMNRGASLARGRWLMFLHADTRPAPGWMTVFRQVDADPRIVGGSFRFALDSPAHWARWIEWGVRLRVRLFGSAYGDQALFVRRLVFEELGGYLELPIMEDVELIRRLRRRGRLEHSTAPAVTSARRWERDGWIRRTVENRLLVALFLAGYPPEKLAHRYRRRAP